MEVPDRMPLAPVRRRIGEMTNIPFIATAYQLAKLASAHRFSTGLFALMLLIGCSGTPRDHDPSNSTYLFAGQTSIRAVAGSGPLEVRDGRLIGDTDRRALELTLYDHKGRSVIVAGVTNHETGERYRGEFTRAQESTSSVKPQ